MEFGDNRDYKDVNINSDMGTSIHPTFQLEGSPQLKKKFNFPVVIKPINEGSSVNVYICTKNDLLIFIMFFKENKKRERQ